MSRSRGCGALESVHPLVKVSVIAALVLTTALFLHPVPSIALIVVFAGHAIVCWDTIRRSLHILGPFAFGFFGFTVVNILGYGGVETVRYEVGPLSISREALLFSLSIFLRVLASVCMAVLLARTVRPGHLTAAIDRVRHRSSRLALLILVIHRLIPDVLLNLKTMLGVRRIRGVRGGPSTTARIVLNLLAATLRRAESLSLAVTSRGYALGVPRSAYRPPVLRRDDLLWAAAVLVAASGIIVGWHLSFGLDGFLAGTAEEASGIGR